jgi:signal transduction histidine kinase
MNVHANRAMNGAENTHGIDVEINRTLHTAALANLVQRGIRRLARHEWSWPKLRRHDQIADMGRRRSNEFMAVLAHELRNSLSAIGSAAKVLNMEVATGP